MKRALMQNLRDKLMKAGLVSNEQAEAAQKQEVAPPPPASSRDSSGEGRGPPAASSDRRPDRRPPDRRPPPASRDRRPLPPFSGHGNGSPGASRSSGGYQVPVIRAAPPVPKLAPLPGSAAHQRLEALKQQEIDQQLRELVLTTQVESQTGEQTFYFQTRKGKLRRLNLSAEQAALLEKGELAVVERQEPAAIEHSLVPAAAAERMLALFPRSVRFFNKPGAPVGFVSESEVQAGTVDSSPELPDTASESQTTSGPDAAPAPASTEPSGD